MADVGGFLALQGMYNQVIDGCTVVSIESSEYLSKQLMLHCSGSGFWTSATYISFYIPVYHSAQLQGHNSNHVPQLYDVYFILCYSM